MQFETIRRFLVSTKRRVYTLEHTIWKRMQSSSLIIMSFYAFAK